MSEVAVIGRMSVRVAPVAVMFSVLCAPFASPWEAAVAATADPPPLPLWQPICDTAVVMLATDAADVRLSDRLVIEGFNVPAAVEIPRDPGGLVVNGKLTEELTFELPIFEVTLPKTPKPTDDKEKTSLVEVVADNQRYSLDAPVTIRLDDAVRGQLRLPFGTVVTIAGGEKVMVAEGTKGQLTLAKGDLGSATVTAVHDRKFVHADDLREITLRLVPSDGGPRLETTVEAPDVDFDQPENRLAACLVNENGVERQIHLVDVDAGDEPGTARVSLAVPRAMSTLTLERFLAGDTTYSGQAYLASESGSYVAAGPARLHGIKASIMVGLGVTLLVLSAIAAMRLYSRDAFAGGIGSFFKGVIVGKSGDASLSLFQIALWTLVTIFALVYVWWRTATPITLTTEMLGLLGFAATGSVAARWIAASRAPGGQQSPTPTNDAIRVAVETAQRLRAEADALRARAEELTGTEQSSKADFEAALKDRQAAEQQLSTAEQALKTAQDRATEAQQDLGAKQQLAATADDATREQAAADVAAAAEELRKVQDAVTQQQQEVDRVRAILAKANEEGRKHEQAILDAARQVAARDTAERLAREADERVTQLRNAGRNPSLVEMLMSDGRLDLFKVQLFLFTTFTAFYVAVRVITDMAFPPIGEGLLLLMGVSNGGYIAAKLAEATPLQKAQALQVELEALEKRVSTLSAEQKQLQDEEAAIGRSLAASDLTPGAKEVFDARLATIKARLASIEKDGKGELPEARAAADAKRKEFHEQLAAATKGT